jgi:hypothetical protein
VVSGKGSSTISQSDQQKPEPMIADPIAEQIAERQGASVPGAYVWYYVSVDGTVYVWGSPKP